jgi:ectoine hydroxylase-related dioxygenase (phytanoyl-CoA dioxygenase family)
LLSDEQVRSFEEAGYFVLDSPCEMELVDAVRDAAETMLRDDTHEGPEHRVDGVTFNTHPGGVSAGYHWQRVKNAWKISDPIRGLALAPRVLATVEQLFGRTVAPFQTLNFPVGTQQPAHTDSFAFQSDPEGFMCGVWVALEDMDMDNGTLVYYPGSHKLPMPTWEVIEAELGQSVKAEDFENPREFHDARHALWTRYCRHLVEEHGFEPEYATIRKGQAMIWSANLLHGGSPQRDPNRTRHSQVTHYFFEGCRVFTPLHSEGAHNYWEYPEWIRDPVPEYNGATLANVIREHVDENARTLFFTGAVPFEDEWLASFGAERFGQGLDDAAALEALRAEQSNGARYIVFPKEQLWHLEWTYPQLQDYLELECRPLLRDGIFAAIYALD